VAFGHAFARLSGTLKHGTATNNMWVRVTFCFPKIDGTWLIAHDQVSVLLDVSSGKGVLDLQPCPVATPRAGEGVFWLVAVRYVFSRRIVGWKTSDRCDTDLILAALEYGIWSRDVGNLNRAAAMTFAVSSPLYRYESIAPVTDHGGGHRSGPQFRIGDRRRPDRPRSPGRRRRALRRRNGGRAPTIGSGVRPVVADATGAVTTRTRTPAIVGAEIARLCQDTDNEDEHRVYQLTGHGLHATARTTRGEKVYVAGKQECRHIWGGRRGR
jgi:hypothetical protein